MCGMERVQRAEAASSTAASRLHRLVGLDAHPTVPLPRHRLQANKTCLLAPCSQMAAGACGSWEA